VAPTTERDVVKAGSETPFGIAGIGIRRGVTFVVGQVQGDPLPDSQRLTLLGSIQGGRSSC
jgi:hypothetical protein